MAMDDDSADGRRRPRRGASEVRFCAAEPAGTSEEADVRWTKSRGQRTTARSLTLGNYLALFLRPRLHSTAAVKSRADRPCETVKFQSGDVPVLIACTSPYHSPRSEVSAAAIVPNHHRCRTDSVNRCPHRYFYYRRSVVAVFHRRSFT